MTHLAVQAEEVVDVRGQCQSSRPVLDASRLNSNLETTDSQIG